VQSPLITFVRVSSPVYWPSNLAEPCAHARLPNPVPSRRPSPRHFSIPFFPFRFRFGVTKNKAPSRLVPLFEARTTKYDVAPLHPAWRARKQVNKALWPTCVKIRTRSRAVFSA
jgi:hypothetical protein